MSTKSVTGPTWKIIGYLYRCQVVDKINSVISNVCDTGTPDKSEMIYNLFLGDLLYIDM